MVCDSSFIKWLSEQPDRKQLLSYLIYVKATSKEWKKQHSTLLESEAKLILGDNKIDERYLGGAFKIVPDPVLTGMATGTTTDSTTKTILYGIKLTDDPPYKSYILTCPEDQSKYEANDHLKRVTTVQIVSGEAARKIIQNFFAEFSRAREISRI